MNRSFYYLAVLLSLGLAIGGGCSKERQKNVAEREIRVTLQPLQKRIFRRQIPVQGTVWPVEYATISAKISGTLELLKVDEGDTRKKGDVLFGIDRQILKNQVTDTWEIVFTETTEEIVAELHDVPEFARVGEYYMVGSETDAKGYTLSFVYSDSETLYMFRDQMSLQEGRLPESANEIAVSDYFLSQFAPDAEIGSAIQLDTESFQGEYMISGILSSFGEKETDTYGVLISKAMLQNWSGFNPAGYRAYREKLRMERKYIRS